MDLLFQEFGAHETDRQAELVDFCSDDSVQDPDFEPSDLDISEDYSDEEVRKMGKQLEENLLSFPSQTSIGNQSKYESSKTIAIKRNRGESYTRKSGVVAGRKCKPLSSCRQQCKEQINFKTQKEIFKSYWSLGTFIKRILFIGGLIEIEDKKSQTLKKSEIRPRNRQHHIKYFINANTEKIRVCQKCFKQCFNETESFLKSVVRKKLEQPNIPFKDCRGAGGGSNKINEEVVELIKTHINSFPAYESHYTRRDTSCKYLHADLTLADMYRLFGEKHSTVSVSMSTFSSIFKGTFGYKKTYHT